jgi:hypothetical protein
VVEPFAGSIFKLTAKTNSKNEPIINDGIDTKAVVNIIIIRLRLQKDVGRS